jgi:hypothetical protein
LELQARWFAGDFGREILFRHGDQIEIVQFGTWNREAGPDFSDAAIRINGSEPIRGPIGSTWPIAVGKTRPLHQSRVRRRRPSCFVEQSERAFFTRTKSNRNVPQVRVDLATLPDKFSANVPLHDLVAQAPLKDGAGPPRASHRRLAVPAPAQGSPDKNIVETHGRDAALFRGKSPPRSVTNKTNSRSRFSRSACRSRPSQEPRRHRSGPFGVAGFLSS